MTVAVTGIFLIARMSPPAWIENRRDGAFGEEREAVVRRSTSVPVELLGDEQVAACGCFDGVPSRAGRGSSGPFSSMTATAGGWSAHRGAHVRLGIRAAAEHVRFPGTILGAALDAPREVVAHPTDQPGAPDAPAVQDHAERTRTPRERRWKITQANGCRQVRTEPVAMTTAMTTAVTVRGAAAKDRRGPRP